MVNIHTIETQTRKGSMELQYVKIMVEKEGSLSGEQKLEYHPVQELSVSTTQYPTVTIKPDTGFDGITQLDIKFTNSVTPTHLYRYRFGSSTLVWSTTKLLDTTLEIGDSIRVYNNDMSTSIVVKYAGIGAQYIDDGEVKAFTQDAWLGFTWSGYYLTPDGQNIASAAALVNEVEL